MTKRLVGWFVLLPLCAVLVLFALANRQAVQIGFDPLSPEHPIIQSIGVPLFVVIYGALIAGVILGGIATWMSQGPQRRDKRHWRRESQRLERELEAARRAPAQPADQTLVEADELN